MKNIDFERIAAIGFFVVCFAALLALIVWGIVSHVQSNIEWNEGREHLDSLFQKYYENRNRQ